MATRKFGRRATYCGPFVKRVLRVIGHQDFQTDSQWSGGDSVSDPRRGFGRLDASLADEKTAFRKTFAPIRSVQTHCGSVRQSARAPLPAKQ